MITKTKKRQYRKLYKRYLLMVPTAGFEPVTLRLEGACSIQLSYVGISAHILYKIIQNNSRGFYKYFLIKL